MPTYEINVAKHTSILVSQQDVPNDKQLAFNTNPASLHLKQDASDKIAPFFVDKDIDTY